MPEKGGRRLRAVKGWIQEQLIGEGAFAKVYRMREENGNRLMAGKVADTEKGISVLCREAEILKSVEHPLFAEYAGFLREEDSAVLLMEYVEGVSLAALLERRGRLPQAEALRIAAELAEGLRYLHELAVPLLYRDLKPDNIRVRPDGSVKLLDLGCVCPVEEAKYSRAGSRGYAAPEQIDGGDGNGRALPGSYSDVYALGKLLHYMLTGQDPCQPPYRKYPIRSYDPALSALLEQLVEQCVEEESAKRPPDMRSVSRRLVYLSEPQGAVSKRLRECAALVRWRLSGRKWEGDFLYEKCVCKRREGAI